MCTSVTEVFDRRHSDERWPCVGRGGHTVDFVAAAEKLKFRSASNSLYYNNQAIISHCTKFCDFVVISTFRSVRHSIGN